MRLASFNSIVSALNQAGVRYLVAGGLAVNAHGFLRYTKDVDLVLDLESGNVKRALSALSALGYRPNVPVGIEQFADQSQREEWVREKNMQVFQLWSDEHPETPIDIFAFEPFSFDKEYRGALIKSLYETDQVRFVQIKTLIAMKMSADREQDRIDVEHLRAMLEGDKDD